MARENVVKLPDPEEQIWQQIREKVEGIEYGTVTITVHAGKVTQLETSTKQRF
ncbi:MULTISPECIES: YezD family protein [unclassified Butyrivibrio]|jgi:hypothetical protein|uniref:YezD family protein n=1 Tax=unclassified Butyrivibrio TaxID=2639466 RepID=UPI0004166C3A|nr:MULTISPECIES: YezD family protein [unclassified Butyrivibrio]MDC7295030.1 YezD family protein [Butyrivibrio sp. DSM 10294]